MGKLATAKPYANWNLAEVEITKCKSINIRGDCAHTEARVRSC